MKTHKKILIVFLTVIMLLSITVVSHCEMQVSAAAVNDYRQWKQGDSAWNKSEAWPKSQYPSATWTYMKDAGCLVTSIAIALRHHSVITDNNINSFNPWICNEALKKAGAFNSAADLYYDRVTWAYPNFKYQGSMPYSYSNVKSLYEQGFACIIKVYNWHFVALNNVSGSTVNIFDPGSSYKNTIAYYSNPLEIFYYRPIAKPTDTQKPTISNVKISNLSASGYTVTCNVSDNIGVTRVAFPTWTHANGQDDLFWRDGTISGNTATFRVNRSEHKGESGKYATHIYAYDAAGNSVCVAVDVTVPLDDISSCDDSHSVNNKHYSNAEQLTLQGWAFSNKAKKVSFKYILDSNAAVSISNVNRGDVKKAYPNTCSFTDVGYRFTINLSKLSIGKHTIKVLATSASGTTETVSNLSFYVDEHAHKYVSSGITKQPTCTETGTETVKCSICSKTETKTVKALGHNYTVTETAATCTQYAGKKYTCSRCKHSYFVEGKKTWSEWSTTYPKNVDKSLIETKKEYRYSDYQTTTSYNSSVSGYTFLNSTWEKEGSYRRKYVPSWPSGYPTDSDFYKSYNKSKVNSSQTETTKIVANEPTVYGYIYYHWCRGTYTTGPINRTTKKAKTGEFCKYHAFTSSVNPNTLTCADDGSRIIARDSLCKDTYWYYPVTMYSQTYTRYKKLNTFYRWTDFSAWSTTAYTASSTRKVETRTLYRYVTSDLGEHTEKTKIEKTATISQDGKATVYCNTCKKTLRTPTIYKIESVKLSSTKIAFNGKTQTPSVTVKDGKGNTLKKGTDYTVKYSKGRKSIGKYTVTVTFKGKYSGTKKLTFEIVPAKVTLSKLTVGSKALTATWKTVSGVTGYEVQYSTSKKFTSKTTKTVKIKSSKTNKTTIKKLTKGKKYYVRIRAYKTVNKKPVYSAWSPVKSVKVK